MKRILFSVFLFISTSMFAQPNFTSDSIVVITSNDTVYVWDYNAWEQCAFQLDYTVVVIDSIITITQIDTAFDATTCNGYHDFVVPVVGLSEGNYRIDIYRDCLYEDIRFIKSFRFEYIINSINNVNELPKQFILHNAYPNPFNPSTTISYQISKRGLVTLKVYDVLGKVVATLVNEEKSAGIYEVEFNSHSGEVRNLPSGVYFYSMQAGDFIDTKKFVVIK